MLLDLTNLSLIPKLLEEIKYLQNEIQKINVKIDRKYDLSRLRDVSIYLGVSIKTIYNYIDDGRFKKDIRYTKTIKNNNIKITFVESAIIKFKEGKWLFIIVMVICMFV